jgi:putative phosphoribosyl transferase
MVGQFMRVPPTFRPENPGTFFAASEVTLELQMIFEDRQVAGKELARKLSRDLLDTTDTVVLGLASGGVPIAYEVSRELGVVFQIFVVNKLSLPGHEEVAIGAVAPENTVVINRPIADELQVSSLTIQGMVDTGFGRVADFVRRYKCGDYRRLAYSQVVLVDDGVATGSSMKAAIQALRRCGVKRIHVGVPVAAKEGCEMLRHIVDGVTCLHVPEPFFSVEHWYRNFGQVTENDVHRLLEKAEPWSFYPGRSGQLPDDMPKVHT